SCRAARRYSRVFWLHRSAVQPALPPLRGARRSRAAERRPARDTAERCHEDGVVPRRSARLAPSARTMEKDDLLIPGDLLGGSEFKSPPELHTVRVNAVGCVERQTVPLALVDKDARRLDQLVIRHLHVLCEIGQPEDGVLLLPGPCPLFGGEVSVLIVPELVE